MTFNLNAATAYQQSGPKTNHLVNPPHEHDRSLKQAQTIGVLSAKLGLIASAAG
ncbi:MAG: hypothetical protein WBA89_07420 [Microcoleus sp.]|uniref:hypothetical protein n=1 Tax=Microcoleus sp. TaxID=44472 RepID=UPI003C715223